jgi:cobalamin biosynthesis Mg chelatase CobN
MRLKTATKREVVWHTNMAGVDLAQVHEKCTRQLAQNAKRNAKFLLNQGKTVRYIARIVFQSARTKDVKTSSCLSEAVARQYFHLLAESAPGHCHLECSHHLQPHSIKSQTL